MLSRKLMNSSKGSAARTLPALSRHSLELCGLAPHNKKLACDRIASLRHGAKVHLPLPHGGTVRVYRAGGAHRRSEVAPLGF